MPDGLLGYQDQFLCEMSYGVICEWCFIRILEEDY